MNDPLTTPSAQPERLAKESAMRVKVTRYPWDKTVIAVADLRNEQARSYGTVWDVVVDGETLGTVERYEGNISTTHRRIRYDGKTRIFWRVSSADGRLRRSLIETRADALRDLIQHG